MNKFKFHTYKSITGTPVVIAVSTYAGKTVKGRAKCDPRDGYDLEKGKELAAARCAEKVAKKRAKRAEKKYNEACIQFEVASNHLAKMKKYKDDAKADYSKALWYTIDILSKM